MINWGIIGCGKVTEQKSGPAFNKVAGSRLVAVMRRNKDLAEDYARRHNVPRYYSDADELINDKEVNAVYIATPPGSHAEYAIRALGAGKPVYIEKPMAANYRECVMINEAAEIAGLPWRVIPEISGAGHFFDLGSHQLDFLDYIFGPVKKVSSLAVNQAGMYDAEDFVAASFLFGNNITATGIWSFASSREANRDYFEIAGDKGIIKTSTFTYAPIVVVNSSGTKEFANERPENIQFYLIEQIVKALSQGGDVVSTGETAARTSRVMDEVVREYYGKRNDRTDHKPGSILV